MRCDLFLILRPRLCAAVEGARQAAEAERAALAERLQGREELLARTRMDLAGAQADMSTLREELTRQAERRSTAEEKLALLEDAIPCIL